MISTKALNEHLNHVAPMLTANTCVTMDRRAGEVFIDGDLIHAFKPDERHQMEEYADTLWTYAQDLKEAQADSTGRCDDYGSLDQRPNPNAE